MTPKNKSFAVADRNRGIICLLYFSSNLAAFGLLLPFVALALVLANVLGHVHGTFRMFCGFATVVMSGSALSRAIVLSQTLRIGKLKVSGNFVQRQEEPRRFWIWVVISALYLAFNVGGVVVLGWATAHPVK